MLSPRVLVQAGNCIPLMIKNPLPVPVKLFRCAEMGTASLAEVDSDSASEMQPGGEGDISPDTHPIDKIDLKHLSSKQ